MLDFVGECWLVGFMVGKVLIMIFVFFEVLNDGVIDC